MTDETTPFMAFSVVIKPITHVHSLDKFGDEYDRISAMPETCGVLKKLIAV